MLGTDVCSVLEADHEVMPRDLDDFDVGDHDATLKAVVDARPDAIVHLAAFADVEACEDRRQEAFRTNALGSMNVAAGAREVGAYLVYLSTDYVFDGRKNEPYLEIDEPRPLNFYGLTKLYGERYVRELTTRHLIVRTSWLFGPNGRNFVDKIIAAARSGAELTVVTDQRGCPTYTLDLARGLSGVIGRMLEGIVHMTNTGDTTWFGLAECALEMAGIPAVIRQVASEDYPARALRPRYSVLGSLVLGASGVAALPPWRDGLKDHLRRRGLPAQGTEGGAPTRKEG
jgi:dTDP-4-dehydrorhamnose reductase